MDQRSNSTESKDGQQRRNTSMSSESCTSIGKFNDEDNDVEKMSSRTLPILALNEVSMLDCHRFSVPRIFVDNKGVRLSCS